MKTKREIVTGALQSIGVCPVFQQSPSAEDFSFAAKTYDDLHAELKDKGLCYWANTGADVEEIPAALSQALQDIVGSMIAGPYGVPAPVSMDEDGRPASAYVTGMRRVRAHIAKKPSGEQTEFSLY